MHLELLDSLSMPGDAQKPNEDSFASSVGMAVVFDGATGLGEQLMPGLSDAHWLAQFASRRLRAHAEHMPSRDALRAAAADAAKSFAGLRQRAPAERYEIPFASMMFASLDGDRLDLLWFGDCACLFGAKSGFKLFGDVLDKREGERARVTKLVQPGGKGPAAPGVRDEFLPALRASRNRVNTGSGRSADGDWLFAPDSLCADHVRHAHIAVEPGARILLASDGFLALASDYERYTPEQLFAAACTRGIAGLAGELREIEAADPDGVRFPRFKRSDDATALLLSVAA